MRSSGLLASAIFGGIFLGCLICVGQSAAADWFPLRPGDRWIYDHESRDVGEGPEHREIHRWQTDRTITGSWPIPEGTLVESEVRFAGGVPPPQSRPDHVEAYLIRGDCIYIHYIEWNPRDHHLTAAFRKDLLAGHVAPDFCFPLTAGKTWGAPHGGDGRPSAEAQDWRVIGMETPNSMPGNAQVSFHITNLSSVLGSGQTADIWFEKGVGVVREEDVHHGTYGEGGIKLLRFEPASGR